MTNGPWKPGSSRVWLPVVTRTAASTVQWLPMRWTVSESRELVFAPPVGETQTRLISLCAGQARAEHGATADAFRCKPERAGNTRRSLTPQHMTEQYGQRSGLCEREVCRKARVVADYLVCRIEHRGKVAAEHLEV